MNWLINRLGKLHIFHREFDYHFIRISMVIVYFFFGYQKWFNYEVQREDLRQALAHRA